MVLPPGVPVRARLAGAASPPPSPGSPRSRSCMPPRGRSCANPSPRCCAASHPRRRRADSARGRHRPRRARRRRRRRHRHRPGHRADGDPHPDPAGPRRRSAARGRASSSLATAARAGGPSTAARLGTGLAGLAIGRRPTTRHVLLVVTAVSALVVFAANAVAVADRNRENRAEGHRRGVRRPAHGIQGPDGRRPRRRPAAAPGSASTPCRWASSRSATRTRRRRSRPGPSSCAASRARRRRRCALDLDALALPDQDAGAASMATGSRPRVAYDLSPVGFGFGPVPPGVSPAEWVRRASRTPSPCGSASP